MAAGALLAFLCMLACSAKAADEVRSREFEFDIPRTTRVMALRELGRQAGGLIVAYLSSDDVEEQSLVGPVKGRLSVDEVLQVLLRSSQLGSRWIQNRMVSVEPRPPSDLSVELPAVVARTLPRSNVFDPVRLEPEEVLVLGWPIRDLTLSVAPVVVMDRDDLEAMGAPTLPDALRYLSQSAYSRPEGYRSSGAQDSVPARGRRHRCQRHIRVLRRKVTGNCFHIAIGWPSLVPGTKRHFFASRMAD